MKPAGSYTCTQYRQEMILLGLKRQLTDPDLSKAEKRLIADEIKAVERQMGMD